MPVDQQNRSEPERKGVEENNKRYQENPQLYRTRQEINEHIFGTIKVWGYNHTNLTGLEKSNGNSLICWYATSNARSIYWACLFNCQNSKMELTYKATKRFVCITNYFFRLKTVLQISYNLLKNGIRTTILPRLGYVLFVKLSEKEVFSQPDVMPL
jgi:hypothetical protein